MPYLGAAFLMVGLGMLAFGLVLVLISIVVEAVTGYNLGVSYGG